MTKKPFVFLLMILCAMSSQAAQVIQSFSGQQRQVNITIPEAYAGHTATFMGTAKKFGNVNFTFCELYDPDGVKIAATESEHDDHNSDSKYGWAGVTLTTTLKAGTYYFIENGTHGGVGDIVTTTVIDWDLPGEDVTRLQIDINKLIEDLRKELSGETGSAVGALKDEVDDLRKALNDAINQNNEDQQTLLKRITEYEKEMQTLITTLQQRISSLEQGQADFLARLDSVKILHEKDVQRLELLVSNLDSKYKSETDAIKSDIEKNEKSISDLDSRFLANDKELREKINDLNTKYQSVNNELTALETLHNRDKSELERLIADKTESLKTAHEVDIRMLQQSISSVDSKYSDKTGMIATELGKVTDRLATLEQSYRAGDTDLQRQINDQQEQLTRYYDLLDSAKAAHDYDRSHLQTQIDELEENLKDRHDRDVADLQRQINELNGKYRDETNALKSELERLETALANLAKNTTDADKALQDQLNAHFITQKELQNQIATLQTTHERDKSELQKLISEKVTLLETEINAELRNLSQELNHLYGQLDDRLDTLNSELGKVVSDLSRLQSEVAAGNRELQSQVTELQSKEKELRQQIAQLNLDLEREIATLEKSTNEKIANLKDLHDIEIRRLETSMTELDRKYEEKTSALSDSLSKVESEIDRIKRDYAAADKDLQDQINAMKLTQTEFKNALTALELQHEKDLAEAQRATDDKIARLKETHEADVRALENSISELDRRYADKTSQLQDSIDRATTDISNLTRDMAAADKDLQDQINDLKLKQVDFQNQLNNEKSNRERDVTDLQRQINEKTTQLQEKINTATADLQLDLIELNNKYREVTSDLKDQLSDLGQKLDNEVSKLSATDKDLYDKISELKEKQADYYSRLEIIKLTHEKDKEALEKELKALDDKYKQEVDEINGELQLLEQQIEQLKTQHERDLKDLQGNIDSTVNQLNSDIKALYLGLKNAEDELAAQKQWVTEEFDEVMLQLELLDQAVTERLQGLENRIKYAVFSDERLEQLKGEFEQSIRDKERDIADLELEIQSLLAQGRDVSGKETQMDRKLEELVKLRNELTDIEFAIKLRHDDSEFAVHEAEINALKRELADLRGSTDLRIQQLEEQLAATEKKMLELIAKVQAEAEEMNDQLKQALADFKQDVLTFNEILRGEREAGDAELKALLEKMDADHLALMGQVDKDFKEALERLKFEQDVQYEDLRTTINNLALQHRAGNSGGANSYGLPGNRNEEVPYDDRDMRITPDIILEIGY